MMGSMRDGAGDEFFALFNGHGTFLKGFAHDSPEAGAKIKSELFYRDLPREFEDCRRQPAFSPEDVTFCLWRLIHQPAWSYCKVDFLPHEDDDGSASILSRLDGVPRTYQVWASDYYERDVPLEAVEAIYQHQPLMDELVFGLNPKRTLKLLGPDISDIGYPA
jgi:hypothetical protein